MAEWWWVAPILLVMAGAAWRWRYLVPAARYVATGRVSYKVHVVCDRHRAKGGITRILEDRQVMTGRGLRDAIHVEHPSGDVDEIRYEITWR